MHHPSLKHLHAVVTGGANGLGRAFCLELAKAQAKIVVADVDLEGAKHTVDLIKAHGSEGMAIEVDVSKWEAMKILQKKSQAWLGKVDLLVNNAGVAVRGNVETVSLEDWNWIMGVNLWGVIHGCKAFLPAMKESNSGYIINVASAAGLISTPRMAPYNLTKAAVVSLSETLFTELINTEINVCVVCPTFFKTDIINSGRGTDSPRARKIVTKAMERSKIQAPEVAQHALEKVMQGQLYALPMKDANWFWRLKRLAPDFFHRKIAASKRDKRK